MMPQTKNQPRAVKQLRADASVNLEGCKFIDRTNRGMYYVIPQYEVVLSRVIREEDASKNASST